MTAAPTTTMKHADPKTKGMSIEARRRKWPLEYSLKDLGAELQRTGILTEELHNRFYLGLLKLAKAVISHKYGTNSRLDYELLPHEIATSLCMTVVKRQKEVFSWTNLTKKVTFDLVSNYLRKEVYATANLVDIDQQDDENHGMLDGSEGDKLIDRYVIASHIRAEDILYFQEVIKICLSNVSKFTHNVFNIQDHVLMKLALYEAIYRKKHIAYKAISLSKTDDYYSSFYFRYNYYLLILQLELAPLLNSVYTTKNIYEYN